MPGLLLGDGGRPLMAFWSAATVGAGDIGRLLDAYAPLADTAAPLGCPSATSLLMLRLDTKPDLPSSLILV